MDSTDLDNKVDIIMRQTNYSREIATEKLKVFENNEIKVIKDYFGIKETKTTTKPIKSVNQEIYKQLRNHLNTAMRDYQTRVEKGEATKIA